jgi:hypothetical protein
MRAELLKVVANLGGLVHGSPRVYEGGNHAFGIKFEVIRTEVFEFQ